MNARIRDGLEAIGLVTIPDFQSAYIDASVEFRIEQDTASDFQSAKGKVDHLTGAPIFRVNVLPSANRKPVCVKPNAPLLECVTVMMSNNYSQLPVAQNEHNLKGIVSWETIGRELALGRKDGSAKDFMKPVQTVRDDTPLLEAIRDIAIHDQVIVKDNTNRIVGIVTTSDLSLQFQNLTEPFLLLTEIEGQLRYILTHRCSMNDQEIRELVRQHGDKKVLSVNDLTFYQYIEILNSDRGWENLSVNLCKSTFRELLDKVRATRNDVMHFNADPVSEDVLTPLRNCSKFLQFVIDAPKLA